MSLKFNKQIGLAVVAGFLLGALWLVAIRLATFTDDRVHYHANFALYIDGKRDPLESFTFYEEVQACDADELNNPRTRVHLHDKVASVAHVHDTAATWGHLFANLGYSLGDEVIKTDDGVFIDGQDGKALRLILNGQPVENVANKTINSEDALLIDFGQDKTPVLDSRYAEITKDAAEYNRRNDPSSCTGAAPLTFGERLKRAVWE